MKNYYILDYNKSFINESFINESFTTSNHGPSGWITNNVSPVQALSTDGLSYLNTIGFSPRAANFFVGLPNRTCDIHTDGKISSYAINYIWGNSSSTMRWFHTDDSGEVKYTTANTPYIIFNNSQVELIEEVKIPHNTLLLVRINIPHNVTNHSKEPRYCLSLRGNPSISWDDAVNYYSKNFVMAPPEGIEPPFPRS